MDFWVSFRSNDLVPAGEHALLHVKYIKIAVQVPGLDDSAIDPIYEFEPYSTWHDGEPGNYVSVTQ